MPRNSQLERRANRPDSYFAVFRQPKAKSDEISPRKARFEADRYHHPSANSHGQGLTKMSHPP
ncbi:hypothetical protein X797_008824 [Metarhizium robertsii]|uniref:Uncharacterized protein n=1 Tax=Metarhizium robertsii TaxID=568076 RepID=A0A014QVX7_9HYPO|nr:hypothetical protein X797_008824 [Metarhizium robertsii]